MKQSHPIHPLCALFPERPSDELVALARLIEDEGFDPKLAVTLYDGQILDGRHRDAAALMAGVEPIFEEFTGTFEEAKIFVEKHNGHNRSLDAGQRALILAKLRAATESGAPLATVANHEKPAMQQHAEIAKGAGVSTRTARRAVRVAAEAAPEVQQQVVAGTMSLPQAEATIKPKAPEKTISDLAKEDHRMRKALDRIGKHGGEKLAKAIEAGTFAQVHPKDVLFWGELEFTKDIARLDPLVTVHQMTVRQAWAFLDEMPTENTKLLKLMWLAEAEKDEPYIVELKGFTVTIQRPARKKRA